MQAASKVLGPYNILDSYGLSDLEFAQVPFAEVRGCQVMLAVTDNFSQIINASTGFRNLWPIVEFTIYGSVQGYVQCLKRQQTRMLTGPMVYTFPYEEAYDQVSFRARNMTGGNNQPWATAGSPAPTAANGYSMTAQVFIQPRGGFQKVGY